MLFILTTISSLISVLNPIGAVPMFITFTSRQSTEEVKGIALKCAFYVFLILVISFISGKLVLDFFGISLNSMKIGGGLIMLLSGVAFLSNKNENHKGINEKIVKEANAKEDISFTPLAMPLLAGPASMSYLISMDIQTLDTAKITMILVSILAVCAFILLVLLGSRYFIKFIGNSGLVALSRIMGFFVMCIGVEMMYAGIKNFVQNI